jgi:NDP-sugar pyrophosphorylase family protein
MTKEDIKLRNGPTMEEFFAQQRSLPEPKYTFTGKKKEYPFKGSKWEVFQIKALRDFGDVKAGDIGGWISSPECLDLYEGNCWVEPNAIVSESTVRQNAIIKDNAVVDELADVAGEAIIKDNAKISGSVRVCNQAVVGGNTLITGTNRTRM